jgi:hypothetical protein
MNNIKYACINTKMEQRTDRTITYINVFPGIPTNDDEHRRKSPGINDKISPIQYSTAKIHNSVPLIILSKFASVNNHNTFD